MTTSKHLKSIGIPWVAIVPPHPTSAVVEDGGGLLRHGDFHPGSPPRIPTTSRDARMRRGVKSSAQGERAGCEARASRQMAAAIDHSRIRGSGPQFTGSLGGCLRLTGADRNSHSVREDPSGRCACSPSRIVHATSTRVVGRPRQPSCQIRRSVTRLDVAVPRAALIHPACPLMRRFPETPLMRRKQRNGAGGARFLRLSCVCRCSPSLQVRRGRIHRPPHECLVRSLPQAGACWDDSDGPRRTRELNAVRRQGRLLRRQHVD